MSLNPSDGAGLLHVPSSSSPSLSPAQFSRHFTSPHPSPSSTHAHTDRKRRLEDQAPPVPNKPSRASSQKHIRQSQVNKHKKTKTPRIYGQQLPVTRLIEVLDHASLQALLEKMLHEHPQVEEMIHDLAPKPSLASAIALTRHKLQVVIDHLPYKCDPASDYSYLRVKPFFNDFLLCLSDFILNFLPPVELDVETCLLFLNEATALVFEVPNFTNIDFQYTKGTAFEQIANTWLVILTQISVSGHESGAPAEPRWDLLKILKDQGLEQKLKHYNHLSNGKFKQVCDYIQAELDLLDSFRSNANTSQDQAFLGLLGDFITLDYSGYSITAQLTQ